MLNIGNLVPASYMKFGSTGPTYHYIWAATSKSNTISGMLISTDGINFVKKAASITSGSTCPWLGFNKSAKAIVKINCSTSQTYSYSITNNNITTHTMASKPTGDVNILGFGPYITYDNKRGYWETVYPGSSTTYGGTVGRNNTAYMTSNGASSAKKLNTTSTNYTPIPGDKGNLFVCPLNNTSYAYYLPSNQNFTSGTYTNKWSGLNTALSNAGISNKKILCGHYMPGVGFVFMFYTGVAIYNEDNNTWSANTVSWNFSTSYNGNPQMMCYEPKKQRLYALSLPSDGYVHVYYTENGTSWSALGTFNTSRACSNGGNNYKKSIAASDTCVIVCGAQSDYALYQYSNNTWTKNSGLSFSGGDSDFADNNYNIIYCFAYTD